MQSAFLYVQKLDRTTDSESTMFLDLVCIGTGGVYMPGKDQNKIPLSENYVGPIKPDFGKNHATASNSSQPAKQPNNIPTGPFQFARRNPPTKPNSGGKPSKP